MTRYCDSHPIDVSLELHLKNTDDLKTNISEIEEISKKTKLKEKSFHRKNYILKSEICKELQFLNSDDINPTNNYLNKYNAITNYFFNDDNFYQNKNDNSNDIKNIDEKIRKSSPGEGFPKIHQNTIYFSSSNCMFKSNDENTNKDNSYFNYDSKMTTINQINNY